MGALATIGQWGFTAFGNLPKSWNITAPNLGIPSSTGTISDALTNATKLAIAMVGLFSVVMIMYGGVQMVISLGSPQRFQKARETLLYAIAGLAVSIGAFAIISFITDHLK